MIRARANTRAEAVDRTRLLKITAATALVLAATLFAMNARAACLDEIAVIEESVRAEVATSGESATADDIAAAETQPEAQGSAEDPDALVKMTEEGSDQLDAAASITVPELSEQIEASAGDDVLTRLASARIAAQSGAEAACEEELRSVKTALGLLDPQAPAELEEQTAPNQ